MDDTVASATSFRDGEDSRKQGEVICVRTKSDEHIIDDGYEWKKYGQKRIKRRNHPRYYFRCRKKECPVKKQVERCSRDPEYVLTTYNGIHNHTVVDFSASPSLPRNSYDLRVQMIDLHPLHRP